MAKRKNSRLRPSLFSSRLIHLRRLRDLTLGLIGQHNPKGRESNLFDYGCGDMPYREVIAPTVKSYKGIDLSINPQADYFIDFDSRTTLPDGVADILLSNQVLEHVDSPMGYLAEAHRLLKDDGVMILSTHGYWFYHPTPNDYWRWTSAGLKKTVTDAGFEIVEFRGIMGLAASGLQLFQDGVYHWLPRFLQPFFSLFMQLQIALLDRLTSASKRDTEASLYILVARKRMFTGS